MDYLIDLVITEEPDETARAIADRTIDEVLKSEKPVGLPSTVWSGALECAGRYDTDGDWYWFTYLCLLLVQRRHHSMDNAQIAARVDMEDMLLEILFGD